MMNNSISSVRILPAELGTPRAPESSKFMETLQQTMDQVQGAQSEAQGQVTELLSGNGADLHRAMIAVEKANLSFQMMVQVRNKIVQAYQQIAAMPF